MTVALATGLTTYIPLYTNIPSFHEAEQIATWQAACVPGESFTIVSSNVPIDENVRDYNDYDWSDIVN